ncbi:hypothetical protein BC936DRAFT_144393 [Jimgerdemannia flammicorona]|uniref:Uncharacterized protein n=1 Tax=Jimgerdemannia flammicorona TaxID=994334 RepID=A0A433DCI5_9FUNG|nr:hypothetical protein BC936DRAFT_144393 [Jimgerdemannia flammicorona]
MTSTSFSFVLPSTPSLCLTHGCRTKGAFRQIPCLLPTYHTHSLASLLIVCQTALRSETIRLGTFLADCLTVGCLKGFRHFEVYLRGREELLLRVYNNSHRTGTAEYRINKSHLPNSAPLAIEQGLCPPGSNERKYLSWFMYDWFGINDGVWKRPETGKLVERLQPTS